MRYRLRNVYFHLGLAVTAGVVLQASECTLATNPGRELRRTGLSDTLQVGSLNITAATTIFVANNGLTYISLDVTRANVSISDTVVNANDCGRWRLALFANDTSSGFLFANDTLSGSLFANDTLSGSLFAMDTLSGSFFTNDTLSGSFRGRDTSSRFGTFLGGLPTPVWQSPAFTCPLFPPQSRVRLTPGESETHTELLFNISNVTGGPPSGTFMAVAFFDNRPVNAGSVTVP